MPESLEDRHSTHDDDDPTSVENWLQQLCPFSPSSRSSQWLEAQTGLIAQKALNAF